MLVCSPLHLIYILCSTIMFSLTACTDDSDSPDEDTSRFTQEYTYDTQFVSDVKYYYNGSETQKNNIKANERIAAYFDYSELGGIHQKLYDKGVTANQIVDLYKLFEDDLGSIYRIAIKVGTTHYEPLLALSNTITKTAVGEAIKPRLKKPESLQLHSVVMCLKTSDVEKYGSFYGSDIHIYADYSAQNGFGGMNRGYCSVNFSFFTCELSFGQSITSYNMSDYHSQADYVKNIF